MAINQLRGKSVYITTVSKINNPQYVAAREMVRKYSKSKYILELAGGPLNSTGLLVKEGYRLINIDLDESFKKVNDQNYGKTIFIKADIEKKIPVIPNIDRVDVVVALDVFEHFKKEKIRKILSELIKIKKNKEWVIIITMPIVDWTTISTWVAKAEKILSFGKLKTGLFDITHKTLINYEEQKRMLMRSGFKIIKEGRISFEGVSGEWPGVKFPRATWSNSAITKINNFLTGVTGYLYYPFSKSKRTDYRFRQMGFRSFFVMLPK